MAATSMNLPLSLEELILHFLGLPIRKPSSRSRGCSLCLGREFRVLIVNNKEYKCFSLDTIARVMHLFGKPVIDNERPLLKKGWLWLGSEESDRQYALLWYDSEEAFVYPEPDRSPQEILWSWLNETMPDIALYTCLNDLKHQHEEENTTLPVGNYLLDGIYHLPDYGYYRIVHSAVIHGMTRLELLYDPLRLFGGIPLAEWMDPLLNPASHENHVVKIIALPNHMISGNYPKSSYTCYCADYIAVATTLLGYTDLKANELALLLALWLKALNPTENKIDPRTNSPILAYAVSLGLSIPSSLKSDTPIGYP